MYLFQTPAADKLADKLHLGTADNLPEEFEECEESAGWTAPEATLKKHQ